jgi:hypothetical protein
MSSIAKMIFFIPDFNTPAAGCPIYSEAFKRGGMIFLLSPAKKHLMAHRGGWREKLAINKDLRGSVTCRGMAKQARKQAPNRLLTGT